MSAKLIYGDFNIDLLNNPVSGDLVRLNQVDSIKRSVKNLILTNIYERFQHPEIGSQVRAMLFENDTPLVKIVIRNSIVSVLEQYEPRIKINNVRVTLGNSNDYKIILDVSIQDLLINTSIDLVLHRVR